MARLGIDESIEMVDFIAAIVNAAGASMEDGVISWWDARHFVEAFQTAADAFKDASKIIGEFKDYDEAERKQLIDRFAQRCDIPFDVAEQAIEWVFACLVNSSQLIHFIEQWREKNP